ncbi:MAG: lipopolysaccharide kinase InaA family protein [Isosphaeraceae bacterium]
MNPGSTSGGSLWKRLTRGTGWFWRNERHGRALPPDLESSVMELVSHDRFHAKQGRSTARVVFHGPDGDVAVYLKRHYRLPWTSRIAALVNPSGRHTPGGAEFAHLARAESLGIAVPEVVAAGEWIGPWGRLQSFLMVAELTGSLPLHEALPELSRRLPPLAFDRLKRALVREAAEITARLHRARVFHKDLYLCHFYLDMSRLDRPGSRLALIDLHRLGEHRLWPDRWRWKDLGQLLYSAHGVEGVSPRDASRFWVHYLRRVPVVWPRAQAWMVRQKAVRYLRHNLP